MPSLVICGLIYFFVIAWRNNSKSSHLTQMSKNGVNGFRIFSNRSYMHYFIWNGLILSYFFIRKGALRYSMHAQTFKNEKKCQMGCNFGR